MQNNKFFSFIKSRRISLNLSLREASTKAGLSHSFLHRLENATSSSNKSILYPSPEVIKGLSVAYSVDYTYLMDLIGYIDAPSTDNPSCSIDIELVFLEAIEKIDNSDSLVMYGSPVSDEEWERLKDLILFNLEFIKFIKE